MKRKSMITMLIVIAILLALIFNGKVLILLSIPKFILLLILLGILFTIAEDGDK